jgi:hypothetical protein
MAASPGGTPQPTTIRASPAAARRGAGRNDRWPLDARRRVEVIHCGGYSSQSATSLRNMSKSLGHTRRIKCRAAWKAPPCPEEPLCEEDSLNGSALRYIVRVVRAFACSPGQDVMRRSLTLLLLATLPALGAGTADLPELRRSCQEESQRHILGRPRAGVELYERSVERRQVYVRDCMASGGREPVQTGSISVPIPPKRPALPGKKRPVPNTRVASRRSVPCLAYIQAAGSFRPLCPRLNVPRLSGIQLALPELMNPAECCRRDRLQTPLPIPRPV